MTMAAMSGVTRPAKRDRHGDDVVAEGEARSSRGCGGGRCGRGASASATRSRRSPRTMRSAALRLASTAEAGEIETWAAASAAASLRPSPTISTRRPCGARARRGAATLSCGGGAGDPVGRCRGASARRARPGASASPERSVTGRPAALQARDGGGGVRARRSSAKVRATAAASPRRSQAVVRVDAAGGADPFGAAEADAARRRGGPRCRGRGARRCRSTRAGRMPASAAARAMARASGWALPAASAAAAAKAAGSSVGGVGQDGLAGGQRAGLVEDDGVDVGEPLQRVAVLEQHALRGTGGRRRR